MGVRGSGGRGLSFGRFAASAPLAGLSPAPAADAAGRVKSRTKVLPSVAVPTGVTECQIASYAVWHFRFFWRGNVGGPLLRKGVYTIQGRWCLRVRPLRPFDWNRISPALTYAAARTTH